MEFKQLLADDDAVSPVIGVILMVAITVILAAVIGTFVLGLGDQVQSTSPSAQFTFEYQSGGGPLEITHDGGQSVPADQLDVTIDGTSDTWVSGAPSGVTSESDVTAGMSWNSSDSTLSVSDSSEARVIWTSESGDQSSTLANWSGPSA